MLKTEEIGNGAGSIQTKQLKRQLEVTQEDLYKMEKVCCQLLHSLFEY